MSQNTSEKLLAFIKSSPDCFHAVQTMKEQLLAQNFTELSEEEHWNLAYGGQYFVTRNGSSIIAFTLPETGIKGFHILASHSDSPSFKIKENPEMTVENTYVKLNVEGYGGMLCAPWMDRPLSVSGRVIVKEEWTLCLQAGESGPGSGTDPQSGHPYEPGREQRLRL